MRLVFFGSGEFALPILEHLADSNEIALVVTRPDSARDRGKLIKRSLVAQFCDDHGIKVFQPDTVNSPEAVATISSASCQIAVLASYSEILSDDVTKTFKMGIVNVHPSLLPKYRGAEPIRWPIRKGEKVTGSTLMLISSGLDRGNILWQEEIPIDDTDTYESLTEKLIRLTNANILPILAKVENGFVGQPQSQEKTFYARKLRKEDEVIDFNKTAQELSRQIRSMDPSPGMYCLFQGKRLKVFTHRDLGSNGEPGQILQADKRLVVSCGSGSIEIFELQLEGGKRMPAQSFLASGKVIAGDIFESVDLNTLKK